MLPKKYMYNIRITFLFPHNIPLFSCIGRCVVANTFLSVPFCLAMTIIVTGYKIFNQQRNILMTFVLYLPSLCILTLIKTERCNEKYPLICKMLYEVSCRSCVRSDKLTQVINLKISLRMQNCLTRP